MDDNKDNNTDDEIPNQLPSDAPSVVSTTAALTSASASVLTSAATTSRSMAMSRSALFAPSSSSSSAAAGESSRAGRNHSALSHHSSSARGHSSSASGSAQAGAGESRDRITVGGTQRNRNPAKLERACSNAPHNSANAGASVRNSVPTNRHDASSSNSRNRHGRNVYDVPQVPASISERQKESASPEGDNDCVSMDDDIPIEDDESTEERALALPIVSRAPSSYALFDPSLRQSHNWQASKSTIKERLSFMFNNELLADVHFVVGKDENVKRIAAHKFVLSIGSAVFDAMFNGGLHMSSAEIELPDVEPAAFLSLLWFFYTDEVSIGPDTVMTSLYTAKKYAVPALERACVEFLKCNLSSDNAFMLLTQARLFDEPQLAALCLEMIDKTTTEALSADSFTDIDLDTLCVVLERDTLGIRECKLFAAVCRWAEAECARKGLELTLENQRSVLGGIISLIRFPLMTVEEFAAGAAQSGLLTDREVVQLFLYYTVSPQPTVSFSDVPRCCLTGKEQVVSRFYQIENRWGYSGTSDRIRFMVNRKIFVVGFGLYGSIHSAAEYQVNMQIIQTDSARTCGANDTTFVSDGSAGTFRVLFKEPIEIQSNTSYTACATIKGPDSYYGTKGSRKVTHESVQSGKVTFQFTYAAGNNNGTSVEDGQLPEIVFYT